MVAAGTTESVLRWKEHPSSAKHRNESFHHESSIERSTIHALRSGRPVLTHLNADTTWLLSLAYPDQVKPPSGRKRFNVLIDPWLTGPQSDVASWFSTQWHVIKSSVQSVAEINDVLVRVENLQSSANDSSQSNATGEGKPIPEQLTPGLIDAVVVSHEFTDHCHRATLEEVHPQVPVFATAKAAELIRSWKHFASVFDIPPFLPGTDWRSTSSGPLPAWLGFSRLVTNTDALYYHSAVIICFQNKDTPDVADAIIYSPHGVESGSFTSLTSGESKIQTLALLHGLHDVSISMSKQLNLGAHNGLRAQQILRAKYWVGTHDEVKKGGGLVAFFLRRKAHTLNDALAASVSNADAGSKNPLDQGDQPQYFDLTSGESLLLE